MKLSTDEYPSSFNESAHRPFHFERLSFLGAFFRMIRALDDGKLHFRIRSEAELFPNLLWNCYLSPLANLHIFQYD